VQWHLCAFFKNQCTWFLGTCWKLYEIYGSHVGEDFDVGLLGLTRCRLAGRFLSTIISTPFPLAIHHWLLFISLPWQPGLLTPLYPSYPWPLFNTFLTSSHNCLWVEQCGISNYEFSITLFLCQCFLLFLFPYLLTYWWLGLLFFTLLYFFISLTLFYPQTTLFSTFCRCFVQPLVL
jgi:hypothetical protein